MRFKDLKLGTKQKVGFGSILLLVFITNVYFFSRIEEIKVEVDDLTANRIPRVIAISDINQTTTELRLAQLQLAAADQSEFRSRLQFRSIELLDQINESRDLYESLRGLDSIRTDRLGEDSVYARYDDLWDDYQQLSVAFFELADAGNNSQAVALLNEQGRDLFQSLSDELVSLVRINRNAADLANARAQNAYRRTQGGSTIMFIITALLAAGLVLVLSRLITTPVRRFAEAAEQVAAGDLDVRTDVISRDEIGILAESFNHMTVSLKRARTKTEMQAEELQNRHYELQKTYGQLEEKSHHLEQQKAEVEKANRNLEEALHQLQTTQEQLVLKEKMAALGDLVAGVAHEINNPIGAVLSSGDISRRCLDRLTELLKDPSNADQAAIERNLQVLRDNVANTLHGSERVATLVRSLKNFARLDESDFQRVDIHEGIDSSLTLLGSDLTKGLVIEKQYGNLPKIPCYPGQLNQVFMAVLRNAIDATPGGGTIAIATETDNGSARVAISDTGKGIPKGRLERIFDISFSASGTRVKMGSGLSSALAIMQKHSGDIKIVSREGEGTSVTITLPLG